VTLTITTPATAINGGNVPTINPTTGTVVVPENTPAGSYTIVYQICDKLKPYQLRYRNGNGECGGSIIDALNDTITVANGTTGR
jgi:hypothetical protein